MAGEMLPAEEGRMALFSAAAQAETRACDNERARTMNDRLKGRLERSLMSRGMHCDTRPRILLRYGLGWRKRLLPGRCDSTAAICWHRRYQLGPSMGQETAVREMMRLSLAPRTPSGDKATSDPPRRRALPEPGTPQQPLPVSGRW